MDNVKHFKVVSSLPTELEKNSIYYVRVGEGFDIYLTNNLGVIAAKTLNQQEIVFDEVPKPFYYQVFNRGQIGGASWFTRERSGNHISYSGSWQGWAQASPMTMPYNCKISKLHASFRQASFDWCSIAGNIFLDIGFLDHNYNSTLNERILRFEIPGSFTGNATGDGGFRYSISNITDMQLSNMFFEGEVIGIMMRTSTSIPGRIFNITDPILSFTFEEIL